MKFEAVCVCDDHSWISLMSGFCLTDDDGPCKNEQFTDPSECCVVAVVIAVATVIMYKQTVGVDLD